MSDKKENEQRVPNQSGQESGSYPEGMEKERKQPDGLGHDKPKPSDVDD